MKAPSFNLRLKLYWALHLVVGVAHGGLARVLPRLPRYPRHALLPPVGGGQRPRVVPGPRLPAAAGIVTLSCIILYHNYCIIPHLACSCCWLPYIFLVLGGESSGDTYSRPPPDAFLARRLPALCGNIDIDISRYYRYSRCTWCCARRAPRRCCSRGRSRVCPRSPGSCPRCRVLLSVTAAAEL